MKVQSIMTKLQSFETNLKNIVDNPDNIEFSNVKKEWIDIISTLIEMKQYETAQDLFFQILFDKNGNPNKQWLDNKTAVLYQLFRAYNKEKTEGTSITFQHFTNLDQMEAICIELIMFLRRIEFNLPEHLQKEIISFIRSNHIGSDYLIEIIQHHVLAEDRIYVANKLCLLMEEQSFFSYHLPLLGYAYDLNPKESDTLFHLCYTLYRFQEFDLAIEFLEPIKELTPLLHELSRRLHARLPFEQISKWHLSSSKECTILSKLKPFSYKRKLPLLSIPNSVQTITGIVCVNNERLFNECALYWKQLKLPKGYKTELYPVRGAKSAASGYQNAMVSVSPGIKIYLHQDLFLTDPYILYDILSIFETDPAIGIIGIAGTDSIPKNCVWWYADHVYFKLFQDNLVNFEAFKFDSEPSENNSQTYHEVKLLDGVFLSTRSDLAWRQKEFDGWHFYDISQSAEFSIHGYKAAIPNFKKPCAIHNINCIPDPDPLITGYYYSKEYDFYRKRFKEIYKDWILTKSI